MEVCPLKKNGILCNLIIIFVDFCLLFELVSCLLLFFVALYCFFVALCCFVVSLCCFVVSLCCFVVSLCYFLIKFQGYFKNRKNHEYKKNIEQKNIDKK